MAIDENRGPESEEALVPAYTSRKTGNGKQRLVLILVALLGASGFIFLQRSGGGGGAQSGGGQGKGKQAGPPPAVPIAATAATQGDMGVYVSALGYVTPVYTVIARTRVDGELMKVNYREGQMVHKGDVLAQVDPRPFEAALLQAQGQYDRDKATLDEAYIDLARYKEAYSRNAIPKQQLDLQQAAVHQDEGTVKVDQGSVQSAQVNLQYCTITSPITGRVGLRLVDPGNIVHAADTSGLLVITEIQPITVVFSVAEDYLSQIRQELTKGNHMQVDAYDRTQQKKLGTGYVMALDNQIDATTGTAKIRAQFQNADSVLFPNQFVNTRLLLYTEHNVTLVPSAAIQLGTNGSFVYIINSDQTASMRQVKPGATDGQMTAVDGVKPGEIVATDGFDKLQNGVKVAIHQGQPQGGQGQQGEGSEYGQQGQGNPQGGNGGGQQGGGNKGGGNKGSGNPQGQSGNSGGRSSGSGSSAQ